MLKNILKNNSSQAFVISIFFILFVRVISNTSSFLFSPIFVFSFLTYFLMFTLAIDALKKNKIIGIYLCVTVFFIPPNIFETYKGLLFPVTYLSHFAYLGYLISLELFDKWKKTHEL